MCPRVQGVGREHGGSGTGRRRRRRGSAGGGGRCSSARAVPMWCPGHGGARRGPGRAGGNPRALQRPLGLWGRGAAPGALQGPKTPRGEPGAPSHRPPPARLPVQPRGLGQRCPGLWGIPSPGTGSVPCPVSPGRAEPSRAVPAGRGCIAGSARCPSPRAAAPGSAPAAPNGHRDSGGDRARQGSPKCALSAGCLSTEPQAWGKGEMLVPGAGGALGAAGMEGGQRSPPAAGSAAPAPARSPGEACLFFCFFFDKTNKSPFLC